MAERNAVRPRTPRMVMFEGKEVDINTLTPKQRFDYYMSEKIKKAHDNDTSIITSKSKNTSTFVNLLNIHDKFLSEMLLSFGANKRITLAVLEEVRQESEEAKQAINQLNIKMAIILGKKYRAPRGFTPESKENATAAAGQSESKPTTTKKPKKKKAKKPVAKNDAQTAETGQPTVTPAPVAPTAPVAQTGTEVQ